MKIRALLAQMLHEAGCCSTPGRSTRGVCCEIVAGDDLRTAGIVQVFKRSFI